MVQYLGISMQTSQKAFTIVELIFVIVILGILAAVAIPKLAATRTDTEVSKEVLTLAVEIHNLGSKYTAESELVQADFTNANLALGCYTIASAILTDGNISITEKASTVATLTQTGASEVVCRAAHTLSRKQKLSTVDVVYHNYGAVGVSY